MVQLGMNVIWNCRSRTIQRNDFHIIRLNRLLLNYYCQHNWIVFDQCYQNEISETPFHSARSVVSLSFKNRFFEVNRILVNWMGKFVGYIQNSRGSSIWHLPLKAKQIDRSDMRCGGIGREKVEENKERARIEDEKGQRSMKSIQNAFYEYEALVLIALAKNNKSFSTSSSDWNQSIDGMYWFHWAERNGERCTFYCVSLLKN